MYWKSLLNSCGCQVTKESRWTRPTGGGIESRDNVFPEKGNRFVRLQSITRNWRKSCVTRTGTRNRTVVHEAWDFKHDQRMLARWRVNAGSTSLTLAQHSYHTALLNRATTASKYVPSNTIDNDNSNNKLSYRKFIMYDIRFVVSF